MSDLVKQGFSVLEPNPVVQAAVAILVLVIAALLAPAPVPVQIESPWLVRHLVEMHLDIENIKNAIAAANAKQDTNAAMLVSIVTMLKRRANR